MAKFVKGQSGNPSGRRKRNDGWQNLLTGIGITTRDKRTYSEFYSDRITYEECRERWRGDDLGARIVGEIPAEGLRKGIEIQIQPEETTAPGGEDEESETDGAAANGGNGDLLVNSAKRSDAFPPGAAKLPAFAPPPKKPPGEIAPPDEEPKAISEALMAKLEELEAIAKLEIGWCYGRAYGGGAVLIGVDDGRPMDAPVAEEKIKSVRWLNELTPRELLADTYYQDPRAARFGQPEVYKMQTMGTGNGMINPEMRIHESRLLLFRGPVMDRQHMIEMQGWGDSVFVRVERVLRDFQVSWESAAILLQDFAQAVYKMAGFAELMAQNEESVVKARIEALDMMRSVLKMALIDDQDELERKQTPLAGLPEMLEKFALRLAAAVPMPVTRLMGQAPAGLNATGESDARVWYDTVSGFQERDLRKPAERLVRYLMLAKDGPCEGEEPENWSLEFNPLWQMSDKEQAEIRELQSRTDKAYVDMSAVTPEEITASRFGGDKWSPETVIDFDSRKALAVEHEEASAKYEEERAKVPVAEKQNAPEF